MFSIYAYTLEQLEQHKGQWPKIAEATNVSKRTIQKIASKEIPNPSVHTIETLARYFHDQENAAA